MAKYIYYSTKKVDFHSELDWLILPGSIVAPQESEKVSVIRMDIHVVEHSFYVTGEGNSPLAKTTEDSS